MDRKKKLRAYQILLLFLGFLIIFFTYIKKNKFSDEQIITSEAQKKIERQLAEQTSDGDVFFNIEYSGLDLAGNRYILKSKEAKNNKNNQEIVLMTKVEAIFYFKDGTVLNVMSDEGIYNNKTLDMKFNKNVMAKYQDSELMAQKAEYSNSKSFLIISNNVKVKDIRGTMLADKLYFDIKKQTLKIASFDEGKIDANINIK